MSKPQRTEMDAWAPKLIGVSDLGSDDLAACMRERRQELLAELRHHGALLFRGFAGRGPEPLQALIEATGGEPMEYYDRAAHRSTRQGRIYSSADYPPSHEIHLHNESTYAKRWPMKLFLHCVRPADEGGETPLADVRRVLTRLDLAILRSFARRGVSYVRNFGLGLFGPSWQTAFQTDDKAELEAYCARSGIEAEWLSDDRLRTRQSRAAVVRHVETGEALWFNHVAALHVSTLPARTRKLVKKHFAEADLPSNAYYGDGEPIEDEVLDAIRDAYAREAVPVAWCEGDRLLVDNMLVAHGRKPFSGERDVVVGMSEPMSWNDVEVVGADEFS